MATDGTIDSKIILKDKIGSRRAKIKSAGPDTKAGQNYQDFQSAVGSTTNPALYYDKTMNGQTNATTPNDKNDMPQPYDLIAKEFVRAK